MSLNVLEPHRLCPNKVVDLWRREALQMCAAHSPPARFTAKTEMVHITLLTQYVLLREMAR